MLLPEFVNVMIFVPDNVIYDKISVKVNKTMPSLVDYDPVKNEYFNKDSIKIATAEEKSELL